MIDSFKAWWHSRTDDVKGIDKLIGAPHSMFRQHVVWPIGITAVLLVGIIYGCRCSMEGVGE